MYTKEQIIIDDRECLIYQKGRAEALLIQPADEHEFALLDDEAGLIAAGSETPFLLCAFRIRDWNRELSPWEAPPVFGKEGFGSGAEDTLAFAERQLIPTVLDRFELDPDTPAVLGGYSLAGLFALWSGYLSGRFAAAAAVSPSVWFPGWIDFAGTGTPKTGAVYLSLGLKEEKARNPVMARVGDCIRQQHRLLMDTLGPDRTVLEWNEGNHFVDAEKRMAKGFLWCMNDPGRLRKSE